MNLSSKLEAEWLSREMLKLMWAVETLLEERMRKNKIKEMPEEPPLRKSTILLMPLATKRPHLKRRTGKSNSRGSLKR
jgi:hypothetical protein